MATNFVLHRGARLVERAELDTWTHHQQPTRGFRSDIPTLSIGLSKRCSLRDLK